MWRVSGVLAGPSVLTFLHLFGEDKEGSATNTCGNYIQSAWNRQAEDRGPTKVSE